MIANLKVHDVTARLRGDDPDRPVLVGYDGTRLILAVDMSHAMELAEILARGDTTGSETWLQALVDVVTVNEIAGDPTLDPEAVTGP